jgi:hypothetical protein
MPKGHDVHPPTLSGCGYLTGMGHQEGGHLHVLINDIRGYIEFEDLSEISAHSFSGMICGPETPVKMVINKVDTRKKQIVEIKVG